MILELINCTEEHYMIYFKNRDNLDARREVDKRQLDKNVGHTEAIAMGEARKVTGYG